MINRYMRVDLFGNVTMAYSCFIRRFGRNDKFYRYMTRSSYNRLKTLCERTAIKTFSVYSNHARYEAEKNNLKSYHEAKFTGKDYAN